MSLRRAGLVRLGMRRLGDPNASDVPSIDIGATQVAIGGTTDDIEGFSTFVYSTTDGPYIDGSAYSGTYAFRVNTAGLQFQVTAGGNFGLIDPAAPVPYPLHQFDIHAVTQSVTSQLWTGKTNGYAAVEARFDRGAGDNIIAFMEVFGDTFPGNADWGLPNALSGSFFCDSTNFVSVLATRAVPLILGTNNKMALAVDGSQKIGIGTYSPTYDFHCYKPAYTFVVEAYGAGASVVATHTVRSSYATQSTVAYGAGVAGTTLGIANANNTFVSSNAATGFGILTTTQVPIVLGTNSTERASVDRSGFVVRSGNVAFAAGSGIWLSYGDAVANTGQIIALSASVAFRALQYQALSHTFQSGTGAVSDRAVIDSSGFVARSGQVAAGSGSGVWVAYNGDVANTGKLVSLSQGVAYRALEYDALKHKFSAGSGAMTEVMTIETDGYISVKNATVVPGTPASGGALYAQAGSQMWLSSSGILTMVAP